MTSATADQTFRDVMTVEPPPLASPFALATRESMLRVHARVLAVHGTPLPGSPPVQVTGL